MSIATHTGLLNVPSFPAGQYLNLAIAGIPHTLELLAITDYRRGFSNTQRSDGRSALGRLKIIGGGYDPPLYWTISTEVRQYQVELFEAMLLRQNQHLGIFALGDRVKPATAGSNAIAWQSGSPATNAAGIQTGYGSWNVFIDVDEQYRSKIGGGWELLQIQAYELI